MKQRRKAGQEDPMKMKEKNGKAMVRQHTPWAVAVGAYLVALSVALLITSVQLWGVRFAAEVGPISEIELFWLTIKAPSDGLWMTLMVIVTGALGSLIHATTSFASYVGNQRFVKSWSLWYFMRPLVGAPLALLFYFTLRGGFLATGGSVTDVNYFGMAALAGMVGMFSKQAIDKLSLLFDIIFTATGDRERGSKLESAVPILSEVYPGDDEPGRTGRFITVRGSQFAWNAVVRVGDADRSTTFVSEVELKAELLEEDVKDGGRLEITVFNPPPGGGTSQAIVFLVE
jgi:hypothetical protein